MVIIDVRPAQLRSASQSLNNLANRLQNTQLSISFEYSGGETVDKLMELAAKYNELSNVMAGYVAEVKAAVDYAREEFLRVDGEIANKIYTPSWTDNITPIPSTTPAISWATDIPVPPEIPPIPVPPVTVPPIPVPPVPVPPVTVPPIPVPPISVPPVTVPPSGIPVTPPSLDDLLEAAEIGKKVVQL